jgi:hypothetical protein
MITKVLNTFIENENTPEANQTILVEVQDDVSGEKSNCLIVTDIHGNNTNRVGFIECPVRSNGSNYIGHLLEKCSDMEKSLIHLFCTKSSVPHVHLDNVVTQPVNETLILSETFQTFEKVENSDASFNIPEEVVEVKNPRINRRGNK